MLPSSGEIVHSTSSIPSPLASLVATDECFLRKRTWKRVGWQKIWYSANRENKAEAKQLQNGYRKANIIRVLQNVRHYHEEKAAEQAAEEKKNRNFHVYKKDHIKTGLALIQEVTDLLGLLFQCNAHA